MLKLPRRYMRSRGFGVHSPFAFSFINDVLRMRSGYGLYCYDSVAAVARRTGVPVRLLRLWARIVWRFAPSGNITLGEGAEAASEVALCAGADASHPAGVLWVGRDSGCDAGSLAADMAGNGYVVMFTGCRELADEVWGKLSRGMCFRNRSGVVVIVAHSHLPRQEFDIMF